MCFHRPLLALAALGTIAIQPLTAALVHHYKLDETFQHQAVVDAVGANNGTVSALFRGETGVRGGAYVFDETGPDSIDLGPVNTILPAGTFTITLWLQFSSNGFESNERILDSSDGDAYSAMTSGFNLKTQENSLRLFAGDGTHKVATPTAGNSTLSQNQWYLVALRYTPSSLPGTTNDGQAQLTAIPLSNAPYLATDIPALTDAALHKVGAVTTTNTLFAGIPSGLTPNEDLAFDGLMDDIKIYDSFLSDQQLADLHNETVPVSGGLRWTFNVDADAEGWSTVNTASDVVVDGDYKIVASGTEPQFISPDNLELELTGVRKVFIRARNASNGSTGRIYFQTTDSPTFTGNFLDFAMSANDSDYQNYEIDLSGHPNWEGTLKQLRLDLPQSGASIGSEIWIDRIAVGVSGNRPNIIFVMADDLGWKDISANGSSFYQTPNIDKLASEGINYLNAFAANPLCSPTRAGVLTGQYPARVRYNTPSGHIAAEILDPTVGASANAYLPSTSVGSRSRLPNGYVTYAETLKAAGYSTAFMGKWHLGMAPYIPDNQGFDVVIGGRQHPGPPGGYFAPFSSDSNIPTTLPNGSAVQSGEHINDVLAAFAADFVDDQRNHPFLLNLWWYDVHGPFQAKADLRDKYLSTADTSDRQHSATMAAMVESMDTGMGVLFDKLEALGLADDTIVIFTSDNGGWMYSWLPEDLAVPTSNYPSRGGKATIWDGGSHVPFFVKWPGVIAPGQTSDDLVNNLDVHATILDMLDLEPYDADALDSQSLVPSLLGQAPLNNNTIYVQFPQAPPATGTFPGAWVRQGDMKLIRFFHGNGGTDNHRYELYNIANDPSETDNLANDNPALVASLDALIEAHLVNTDSLRPVANPNYVPPNYAGWTPNYGVWIQDGSEGRLKMVSNSYLPALDSPDLSALPTPRKVRVKMQSRSFGDGRIWWQKAGDTEFTLAQSQGFAVTHDNIERLIEIPINPGGPITKLRYQPSSDYFETELTSIELRDENEQTIHLLDFVDSDGDGMTDSQEVLEKRDPNDAVDLAFEFNIEDDFQNWDGNNVDDLVLQNGFMRGSSATSDPQLSNTSFSFDANSVAEIRVKFRSDSDGAFQFFWGRVGADSYAAARRLDLTYNGAGAWQYILIDTATLGAEWTNQTITRIRIDPGSTINAEWEIDWIRSIDGDFDNDGLSDADEGGFSRDTDQDGIEDFADTDSDNDGAPDAIEASFGRDPYSTSEASANADGDRYSDLFEMIAGTDPDSATESFQKTFSLSKENSGQRVRIQFPGKAGRTYKLLRKTNLLAQDWSPATQTTAEVDTTIIFDQIFPDTQSFFTIQLSMD
ncbi:sulfatase-like hydrolase/transferase [Coraliomargarita sp. W4R53]